MADDLIFTLRFNTKIAENEVSRFSNRLRTDLQKAFQFKVPGQNLSRALGLKTAIDEMKMLDSQMKNLQKSLRTFSAEELKTLQLEAKMNQYRTGPKGGLINPATGERIRGGRREALRMAENNVGIDNESEELKQINEALAVKEAEEARIAGLNDLTGAIKIRAKQERTEANRLKGVEALRRKEMNERLQQIRTEKNLGKGRRAFQTRSHFQALEELLGSGSMSRTTRQAKVRQAAMDFASAKEQGKVSPGETFRNFMPGGKRALDGSEAKAPNALGISPTATGLLALSSILAPLNAQLGMVTMQAGFAAFSLGAPAAALSVLSSAAAGLSAVLKGSIESAKKAGLETKLWNDAQIRLRTELNLFNNVIGVKTQNAFAGVVDEFAGVIEALQELPWDQIIDGARDASLILVDAARGFAELSVVISDFMSILPGGGMRRKLEEANDEMGLQGSQRVDMTTASVIRDAGKVAWKWFTSPFEEHTTDNLLEGTRFKKELDEIFQEPKKTEFIHTPKLGFSDIESLGKSIQESIFKVSEKDPVERAIEQGNAIQREQLTELRSMSGKSVKTVVDETTPPVAIQGM